MTGQAEYPGKPPGDKVGRRPLRSAGRDLALQSALRKRAAGVPSYTIPEAAALCSVSPEHLYRLVRADAFPAIRMRRGGEQGRYVIPARAVEQLLRDAAGTSACLDISEWATAWTAATADQAGGSAR